MKCRNFGSSWEIQGPLSTKELLDWNIENHDSLMILLLYGSWNQFEGSAVCEAFFQLVNSIAVKSLTHRSRCCVGTLQVDQDDICESFCIGDCDATEANDTDKLLPILNCPATLPAIVCLARGRHCPVISHSRTSPTMITQFLSLQGKECENYLTLQEQLRSNIAVIVEETCTKWHQHHEDSCDLLVPPQQQEKKEEAIRLFIAGDRSQVGKSSVCLGLLGSLLKSYPPSSLAYIKPATQCEATQLVTEFCALKGIEACPIGPLLYYKGFTRAFLNGQTETSEDLLKKCAAAVDKIARGKKIVLIDGVGYPAVGSICGTDNAQVAKSCGYNSPSTNKNQQYIPVPVLLVGKSGVGDAIDSYNLNATYFRSNGVSVLGCIFNRLSMEGFYSLENCKKAILTYFQSKEDTAFGFIPEVPGIAKSRENNSNNDMEEALEHAHQFISIFDENVNVKEIIQSAKAYQQNSLLYQVTKSNASPFNNEQIKNANKPNKALSPSTRKRKYDSNHSPTIRLTREQIEEAAKSQGAAGG